MSYPVMNTDSNVMKARPLVSVTDRSPPRKDVSELSALCFLARYISACEALNMSLLINMYSDTQTCYISCEIWRGYLKHENLETHYFNYCTVSFFVSVISIAVLLAI